jgi:predicted Zn-dependent peptidase
MKINETTLANGLRIVTAEMRESRSVAVNIAVATGSRLEDFHLNGGVSHFLEHLLFKGTKQYPTAEIMSEVIEEVGGYNSAYTTVDMTNYFLKVPARHTELAFDIMADMIKNPVLDKDEIERERGVILEEFHMWQDDAQRLITTLYPGLLFPDNPLGYSTFGPEEVINTIPRKGIVDYFKTHYRPNNLVVSVAGKLDHEVIVALVESHLGDLEPGELPGVQTVGREPGSELVKTYQKDTAQAHFVIVARGYPHHHVDAPTMQVIMAILGFGASSRLYTEIRERRGLAYHVDTGTENYVDTGMIEVYVGAMVDKADEAMELALAELERLRHEPVGERELKKVKEQIRASLEMSQESNSGVADRLSRQLALEGQLTSVDDMIKEILAVTFEDVQRVAHEALAPEQLRAAIIAPDPEPLAQVFAKIVK